MYLIEVAQLLQSSSTPVYPKLSFSRVTTDSRKIKAGDLFIALHGANFNGNDFVHQALEAGAVSAIVDQSYRGAPTDSIIRVENTTIALGQLAQYWRDHCNVNVIALTGSSGKTTVKEMLATILRQIFGSHCVLATAGNFNNHIGVPLTLLNLEQAHRFAVVEMGMSHRGEIRYLSQLVRPDIALVNNAHGAHLASLGSIAAVAQAKAEIYEGLSTGGIAIFNNDDQLANTWRTASSAFAQCSFGLQSADISADQIILQPWGSRWNLVVGKKIAAIQLAVPGVHNIYNALAAAAAAHALGLDIEQIAKGLMQFTGVVGRLQQKQAYHGALLIDDTYNANPNSIQAAIDVLAKFSTPRWLILGDMGETGNDAIEMHQLLGNYAAKSAIDGFFALGEYMHFAVVAFKQHYPQGIGEHFTDIDSLVTRVRQATGSESTILVKGSRYMHMERVVAALERSH